jgi:predicted DNA-binding protein (MmcQ/YjbR family)
MRRRAKNFRGKTRMIDYERLETRCLSKKGATKEYKAEWEATLYKIGDKMFAMRGADKSGRSIITLKADPTDGAFLRERYKDIIAGYYMNKTHWNSVYLDGAVPDDLLDDLIDKSYDIILRSLPKKTQKAILDQ